MEQPIDFKSKIPANKFYPPRFDPSQNIFRQRLVEELLETRGGEKQVFLIEAQAGQGKTTLAIQYLEQGHHPHAWYQIGREDSDPILFLTALLTCLKKTLPAFQPAELEAMLQCGDVTIHELERCANLLLADLDAALPDDFHLVFDDLHLLEGHAASLAFLDYLVITAPPQLRFIIMSRHTVRLKRLLVRFVRSVLRVGNDALAMSPAEAGRLLTEVMGIEVTEPEVAELHRATDGWTMGLILAGHAIRHGGTDFSRGSIIDLSKPALLDYFQEEIFAELPTATAAALLRCALLDEIPLTLAVAITGQEEIGTRLTEMMEQNFFVRSRNPQQTVFTFHHLFQGFLADRARASLPAAAIREVFNTAAAFYQDQAMPAETLGYYLRAENYDAMEEVLRQDGMLLHAHNRTITLAIILDRVPAEVARTRGWILLFTALAHWDSTPTTVLAQLTAAQEVFHAHGDKVGELLALAQCLYCHWIGSSTFTQGAALLPQAEALLAEVRQALPAIAAILTAKNIAASHCFFTADMERTNRYATEAMELARRYQVKNCMASILLLQGYQHLMLGRRSPNRQVLEEAQTLIDDPQVGTSNRLSLWIMQLNDLEMQGNFPLYAHQEAELLSRFGREVVQESFLGPLLFIWQAAILVADGRLDEALQQTVTGLKGSRSARLPHVRSQLLQWQAYILALQQKSEAARAAADESLALRAKAGGPYFTALNRIVIGTVHGQLGHLEEAVGLIEEGIWIARQLAIAPVIACGHLHRAALRLTADAPAAARADLAEGLKLMRKHDFRHFPGWTPAIMTTLLVQAVREKLERPYARKLAAQRLGLLLLDDGTPLPLLTIRTFGRLTMGLAGHIVLSAEDLTPAQRELLALLLAAPGQRLGQEKIQLSLWPESPPEKARSKFDSLLLRLRKTIGDAIAPQPIKHYLSLKKGILCLESVQIDANDFAHHARQGIGHGQRQEWWQAGNAFFEAASLWRGCFLPDLFGAELVDDYRMELRGLFIDFSRLWGQHLAQRGRIAEAIRVMTPALKHYRGDSELTAFLHALHLRNHDPVAAQRLVREYEQFLRAEEYPEKEIAGLVAQVAAQQG